MNETANKAERLIDQFLSSKWIPLWIFLLGITLFTVGYRPEFIGFQTRFGLFAKEMLRNGISFFPTTYGNPYPDYPAMSTILIWLFSWIPGKVTMLTAILPTAITSSLILVFIYKIGDLKDRKWGLYAVLIALLTYDFIDESRTISLDQYMSLMTILCVYVVHTSTLTGRRLRLCLVPLFLVGGFAFRGPIGLVTPASVIGGYYLWKGSYKKAVMTGMVSLALLTVCMWILLWAARVQGGESFARQVFDAQGGSRVAGQGREPVFYYWLSSFTHYSVAYPLALLVLIYKFKDIIKRRGDLSETLGYLGIWMLIILIGFTIPSAKKMRYVLPFVPAISLMAACVFIDESSTGKLNQIRKLFLGFCCVLPIITFCIGVGHLVFTVSQSYPFHWFYGFALVFLGVLIFVLRHVEKRWIDNPYKNLALLTIGAAAFIILQIGYIEPVRYDSKRTEPFIAGVMAFAQPHNGKIAFFRIHPDSEPIQFLVNLNAPVSAEFINDTSELSKHPLTTCYIAYAKDFFQLPMNISKEMHVICNGSIGRKKCVAFTSYESEDP